MVRVGSDGDNRTVTLILGSGAHVSSWNLSLIKGSSHATGIAGIPTPGPRIYTLESMVRNI